MMINELVKSKLRAKFISREATSGMISLARKNEEKISLQESNVQLFQNQ